MLQTLSLFIMSPGEPPLDYVEVTVRRRGPGLSAPQRDWTKIIAIPLDFCRLRVND